MCNVDEKIVTQLLIRGATAEQARGYVDLMHRFEHESDGEGELHHILPRNSGWWKRFENMKWNLTQVEWHLHIALHSYLCHIFPRNSRLLAGLRMTTLKKRTESIKRLRYKQRILSWYEKGRSAPWIAERVGSSTSLVYGTLRNSGATIRTQSESITSPKKKKFKSWIIEQYQKGNTAASIGKRVGVTGSTICCWLHFWRIAVRPQGFSKYFIRLQRLKPRIIKLYQRHRSTYKVGKAFGFHPQVIGHALKSWGIKVNGKGGPKTQEAL